MGTARNAKCLRCGATFVVCNGSGMFTHLVRCNQCGEEKHVCFAEVPDWEKADPYSEQFEAAVELASGVCPCGGTYRMDAPPRCPKCRSRKVKQGEDAFYYD